jgi:hydrogenase nickel incorporation protein HypB
MCATCGCSADTSPKIIDLDKGRVVDVQGEHPHPHPHPAAHDHHTHNHVHGPGHEHHHYGDHRHQHSHYTDPHHTDSPSRLLRLEQAVLAKNNRLAERNRGWLAGRGIVACNLMSSPGAGKTTLLERTIRDLSAEFTLCVIEGDQETVHDAERIRATGCRVVQINTGSGCHLDAEMLAQGLRTLDPPLGSLLMIENVGNLVCPALFDLGEHAKVVIMSVTEGEDKPLKYPHMFRAGQVMVLNKVDLLPYVQFDTDRCRAYARQVNPHLRIFQLSATRGDGLDAWYAWLREQRARGITEA